MPPAVLDLVAVLALVALLAVAFVHPREWVEGTVGLGAAALMVALGALDLDQARAEVRELFPVVAFLCAILVVATVCAAEGVFRALGGMLAHASRRSPTRMLGLTFLTAAVTTAVLSLDATVVLLTPVAVLAATSVMVPASPVAYACARLANSASLLLPVSNLTNLLALPYLDLSFHAFVVTMAPVWVAVLVVEYVGLRLFFRRDLADGHTGTTPDEHARLPVFPVAVVALMLVGFAVGSTLDIEPAWVAGVAALVLVVHALARRRVSVAAVVSSAHLSFGVFVLGLGVVVEVLADGVLGDAVRRLVPGDAGLMSLLVVAAVATVLSNLVNNLPATLLLVPLVAPLGSTAVLAALVGLNVGSGLTYPGSLANLLWRRSLVRLGTPPSAGTFHGLAALVTPPAVLVGVVTLWAWLGLLA